MSGDLTKSTNRRDRDGLHRHAPSMIWCFTALGDDGRHQHHSTKTTIHKAARDVRNLYFEQKRNNELPTEFADWPLGKAIDAWMQTRASDITPHEWKQENNYLKKVSTVLGAGRALSRITPIDLDLYKAKRMAMAVTTKNGHVRKPGNRVIKYELRLLSQILRKANLWSRFKEFKMPRVKKSDLGRRLTDEEQLALVQCEPGNRDLDPMRWASMLALALGMRGGEIKKLRLGDVTTGARGTLHIYRFKYSPERWVPLNPQAEWALSHITERARLLGCSNSDHYLFPACLSAHTKEKDPLKGKTGFDPTQPQQSWRTAWSSLTGKAKVGKCRFHDLRHTFISMAAEQGKPLEVVRDIVGHMSKEMTQYYIHVSQSFSRDLVNDPTFSRLIPKADADFAAMKPESSRKQ